MGTTIDQSLEKVVNEKLQEPLGAQVYASILKKLNDGFFDHEWVDAIFQKWERYPITIYDAYAFGNVWTWIGLGQIYMAQINIEYIPVADRQIEEMNQILQSLWYPFSGTFWGGTQDEDGIIEIAEPIELQNQPNFTNTESRSCFISGSFPLEVGYVSAAKTMVYMNGFGRLARWPYGSRDIWLFQRDRNFMGCLKLPYERQINKQMELTQ